MLSPHDADLVRRDPNVPGLSVLLDSDAFLEMVSGQFPSLAPAAAELQYLRYKPRTSCLCLYRVISASGPSYVYAKASVPGRAEKLRYWRSDPAPPPNRTRGALEAWHLGLSRFPDDRRLRALKDLHDAAKRQTMLASAFGVAPDDASGSLTTLRYKPERRYVAALVRHDGPAAVLKLYASGGYREARARATIFRSRQALLVPANIGARDSDGLLGFEWVSGRELHHELSHGAILPAAEVAGAALAELHGQQVRGLGSAEGSGGVLAAAASVAVAAPRLAARVQSLSASIACRLQDHVGSTTPAHGDFNAEQVILIGHRAAILDFDRACLADPALDLGTLAAHLQYGVLRGVYSEEAVEGCLQALLDGYGRTRPVPSTRELSMHVAAALIRLAPEPFRRHEEAWHDVTEALLDRAARALLPRVDRSRPKPDGEMLPPEWSFLRSALDPVEARPSLDAALSRLDVPHATVRHVRVSRHKPRRRCIIEFTLDTGPETDAEPLVILGKSRIKGLNTNAHLTLESLWSAGFNPSNRSVCVPQPLGMVPAWRMTLQRRVKGDPAGDLLEGAEGPRIAERVAEAIFQLHTHGPAPARRHTIADELQILRVRLQQMREHVGASRIGRLLQKCERLASALAPSALHPIHRDFYPDHVLIDGDRVWLLDLDLYTAGDPALDVGNFIAHVIEARLRRHGSGGGITEAESTLEARYAQLAGRHVLPAIRAYTTLSLVRHVHLSTQYPERFHTTAALLDLCEQRLSAGVESRLYA